MRIKPQWIRLAVALALGTVGVRLKAEAPGEVVGPTVELPPFTVTDTRLLPKPESWRYASVPGFEFLTNVAPDDLQDILDHLMAFRRAVDAVWPVSQMKDEVPAAIIFCENRATYAEFCPPSMPQESTHLFVNGDEAILVLNAGLDETFGAGGSEDTQDDLQWFYVDAVLHRIGDHAPPWLREGLERLLRAMVLSGENFEIPAVADGTLAARQPGSDEGLKKAIGDGTFLPLGRVFSAEPKSGIVPSGPWSDECCEWAHLCLLGAQGKYRLPFLKFALLASREPADEAQFRQLFGMDYQGMLAVLWHDADFAKPTGFKITGAEAPEPQIAFRSATDGEVGRLRGETLLCQDLNDAAHLSLIAPYTRGSRDPQLLASLGLQEALAGRDGRARLFLEAAAAARTTRARAYAELARLRLDAALAQPKGTSGTLSVEQLAWVFEPLASALKLPPALPDTYLVLADGWAHSSVRPRPGHLALIDQGAERFPFDTDLAYRDATVHLQFGDAAGALGLCEIGLWTAKTDADRDRFRALRIRAQAQAPASPAG